MHSTFDLCKKYLKGCCASGLHEAILAKEEFGGKCILIVLLLKMKR